MLHPAKKPNTAHGASAAPDSSPDESAWLQQYREHLGRLYEPPTDLPLELAQLVKALARRATDGNAREFHWHPRIGWRARSGASAVMEQRAGKFV